MADETVKYLVNGQEYIFEQIYTNGVIKHGYCEKVGKWALLLPRNIQFEGEYLMIAERILD